MLKISSCLVVEVCKILFISWKIIPVDYTYIEQLGSGGIILYRSGIDDLCYTIQLLIHPLIDTIKFIRGAN